MKVMNFVLEFFMFKGFENFWLIMFKDMMEMFFGNMLNKDGLDVKMWFLLILVVLIVLGG